MRSRPDGLCERLEASSISQTAAVPTKMNSTPTIALSGVDNIISPRRCSHSSLHSMTLPAEHLFLLIRGFAAVVSRLRASPPAANRDQIASQTGSRHREL